MLVHFRRKDFHFVVGDPERCPFAEVIVLFFSSHMVLILNTFSFYLKLFMLKTIFHCSKYIFQINKNVYRNYNSFLSYCHFY